MVEVNRIPRSLAAALAFGLEQMRRVGAHRREDFVGMRVDHGRGTDEDGGDDLVAAGSGTHSGGGVGVLPDVGLDQRYPAPAQPKSQYEAERAARTPVELGAGGLVPVHGGSDLLRGVWSSLTPGHRPIADRRR